MAPASTAKTTKTTKPKSRITKSAPSKARASKSKAHKFSIVAEAAQNVSIARSFNEWTPQALKRGAKGVWSVSLPLAPGTYEYKFVVDSEWLVDPANPERTASPFGGFNSVCTIL